jgi:predicted amidophosphoribosyltransferase
MSERKRVRGAHRRGWWARSGGGGIPPSSERGPNGPRTLLGDLLDALLPARCPGCGAAATFLCDRCAATLVAPAYAAPPAPLDWWACCFVYAGAARELVARAKYRGERRFLDAVAPRVAGLVSAAPACVDLVTWVPASRARLRSQGVDHGELLAVSVARALATPVVSCLVRGPGPAQTGLAAHARRDGPHLQPIGRTDGANVLVVDDVATTGGTLAAAARALRSSGADAVFAVTIARTPRPGTGSAGRAYTPATPIAPTDLRTPNSLGNR